MYNSNKNLKICLKVTKKNILKKELWNIGDQYVLMKGIYEMNTLTGIIIEALYIFLHLNHFMVIRQ